MGENKRRIDRILEEGYLDDLSSRSTEEIREMRAECSAEEALSSYERRLLHGRLAILKAELERRAGGNATSIVDRLPDILADEHSASRGAFPVNDPELNFGQPRRRVTKLVSDDTLANLESLDEDAIRSRIEELKEVEHEISIIRKQVFDVLDVLNQELARRYQTGEANPSDLLTGH